MRRAGGFDGAIILAGFIGLGELTYVVVRGPEMWAVGILAACAAVVAAGVVRDYVRPG